MIKNLKNKSPYLGLAFLAIVISLICNFSYLILLVSNPSNIDIRANGRRNKHSISEVAEGRLSVHGDGYGYIITDRSDSIYVDYRRVKSLGLKDGDYLKVNATNRTSFEASHLFAYAIIQRNGADFD